MSETLPAIPAKPRRSDPAREVQRPVRLPMAVWTALERLAHRRHMSEGQALRIAVRRWIEAGGPDYGGEP